MNSLGKIYCINLPEEIERKKIMEKRFEEWGMDVSFSNGIRASNHNIGCWLAHKDVYRKALKNSEPYVTVFEDDAIESIPLTKNDFKSIRKIMREDTEWRVIMLGYDPIIHVRWKDSKGLDRIRSMCGHAYIISKKGMEEIINSATPPWFYIGSLDTFFFINSHVYTLPHKMNFETEIYKNKLEQSSQLLTYLFIIPNLMWWNPKTCIIICIIIILISAWVIDL